VVDDSDTRHASLVVLHADADQKAPFAETRLVLELCSMPLPCTILMLI